MSPWQLQRVVCDTETSTFTVELHAHLTVVRTTAAAIDVLVTLLDEAVRRDRPGVHVELTDSRGRALVAFRPHGGKPRYVDVEAAAELTRDEFDQATSIGPVVPVGDDADVRLVMQLAGIDQVALWDTATALAAAAPVNPQPPTTPEQGRPERKGLLRRRARSAPDRPAARDQEALQRWKSLVGEVDVRAALRRRAAVESFVRLRARLGALAALGAEGSSGGPYDDRVVAGAVCRLVPTDGPGAGPHVVALRQPELDGQATSLLLDTLAWLSAQRQIVVVSAEDSVAEWVRLESHGRKAALVEVL